MRYVSYTEQRRRVHENRCARDRLLEATQDGMLDPQVVVEMCARYMTSDEIYDMCDHNEVNLARITCD